MSHIDNYSKILTSVDEIKRNDSDRLSQEVSLKNDQRWNKVLKDAFRDPLKLLEYLELDAPEYIDKIQANSQFSMLVRSTS